MIQNIRVPSFNSNNLTQQTELTADIAAGVSALTVKNNDGFATGYGLLGQIGGELSELIDISGITGDTTISLSTATDLAHKEYDRVYMLFGNQMKLYRAANVDGSQPADSEFAVVGSAVDISTDRTYTVLTDSDGGSDYWYKFTYYNSTTDDESDLSNSNASRGGGGTNYCSIDSIRHEAGFDDATYITDQMIDAKRRAAQDEVNSTLSGVYTIPFTTPVNPWIVDITVRLAAGLLLVTQYSAFRTQSTANGSERIESARADLKDLQLKQKVLTDETGTSTALDGSQGSFSGWPNANTASTDVSSGGSTRAFRMGDIEGYGSRRY